ncbi:MAG: leucine-rich repeat domain-containing protein, partial [Clostridia bacterium]|nr:leucine-rich repeat domain-containing protein [Clostridia bacterium]
VPDSVTSIGAGAFQGCNNLASISLPFVGKNESATNEEAVFGYIFGYTTTTTNSGKYKYSQSGWSTSSNMVTSYSTTSNVQYVKRTTTTKTNSSSYSFTSTDGYTIYSDYTYYSCDYVTYTYGIPATLKTVTITNATKVADYGFINCTNIESITLNDEVITIGSHAFRNCSTLTTADIGTGLTTLNSYAFYNCSKLESVTIPYGVNTMGGYAFTGCSSLSINCQIEEQPSAWTSTWNSSSRPVTWGYGCERGTTSAGLEWISIDGETARIVGYEGTATSLTIPTTIDGKTVNRIAANAFSGNTTLTSVVISNSVVIIEANAFANMTSLNTVVIANTVTEIQANAFTGCTNASILCKASAKPSGWISTWNSSNRPVVWNYAGTNGVTSDGLKWASVTGDTVVIYGYSGSNASVTIPTTINGKMVSGISENAFRGNTTITSVFIPTCIEYIGSGAFVGCSNLTINCEIASAPSGWSSSWKDSSTTVYWSM